MRSRAMRSLGIVAIGTVGLYTTHAWAASSTQPAAPVLAPVAPAPIIHPVATTQPAAPTTTGVPNPPPTTAALPPATTTPAGTSELGNVVVTANLDEARDQIAPSLGAATYSMGPSQIASTPRGQDAPFQQVLLRAPGVVEDSYGQEHVRGEHGNLTYRVNGVILPQPLNGFGQELDTHLIDSVTLIDGTLPAQFGFHTAGIVDVNTKTGKSLNGSEISIYGGGYDTYDAAYETGGTDGNLDYFVTTSYKHNNFGIENTTGSHSPIHDETNQERMFTYLSYRLDDTSRITAMINASYATFELPDTPGLPQEYSLANHPNASSSDVNEQQNEQNYYGVISYQQLLGDFSYQISAFNSYGQIHFMPDYSSDLIYQGVSSAVFNNFITNGVQFDASYYVNEQHILRFGFQADYTVEALDTGTAVFSVDAAGNQTSDMPEFINDNSGNQAWEYGL
ncbi:MAG TPA: hypothetical protein VG722_07195, partial [Tepidisphaeraceae bacterium]|nr:hypothetical protein [Tepidisphaeraceae bacterium]